MFFVSAIKYVHVVLLIVLRKLAGGHRVEGADGHAGAPRSLVFLLRAQDS